MNNDVDKDSLTGRILDQLAEIEDTPITSELKRCQDLLESAKSYWSEAHAVYKADLAFSNGEQWDQNILNQRDSMQRQTTTYNIVPALIRQITGVVRQAPPGIKIQPLSGGANKDNAQIIQGVIRAIETQSNAQYTYTSSLENACEASLGAWRIVVEPKKTKKTSYVQMPKMVKNVYGQDVQVGVETVKQVDVVDKMECRIKHIQDPTKLFFDPCSEISDFSDATYCVFERSLSEKDYKKNYPMGKCKGDGEGETVTIYELWEINDSGLVDFKVFDQYEVLHEEETELTYIPFVLMTGKQFIRNNKRVYQSLIHDIKPVCQELNYIKSEQMSLVSSAPKHLVTAQAGTLENPQDWADAAIAPKAVLYWNGDVAPQFNQGPPPPVGYMEVTNQSLELVRQITGIYQDPAQQANLANASGKAIKYQQANSSVQTFHMLQNLQSNIKRTGQILLDMISAYYNDDDIRMAIGVDDKVMPVSIGPTQVPGVNNIDMSIGEYAVTISSGASYASNREAMMDSLGELIKANPQIFALIGDWYIQQMDAPGSEEVSDRLRAMLPPNVLAMVDSKTGENPSDVIRQQGTKLAQMMSQLKMQSEHLDMLASENEKLKSGNDIKIAEIVQKKELADDKIRADFAKQEVQHDHEDQIAKLNATMQLILAKLNGDQQGELENMKSLNRTSEGIERMLKD